MSNLPFTLRQLDVFASLAASRSFRRSAEQLGISQASVSSQISALEEQLGVALFDRRPGSAPVLRPEGLAFLDDLRQFQEAASTLAAHRRATVEEAEGPARFRLLVGQGMFDGYVRRKIDAFYAAHPGIQLDFEAQLPFGELIRAVEGGLFDFALINHRADHGVPSRFRQLAMVRGGVYGHRKFAAGCHLPLTPEQLSSLPFILPQAGSRQEREAMRSYEMHGIVPRRVVGHTQYYDVMAGMLDRGLGVASFSSAILPPPMRQNVILLRRLEDWRLVLFRSEAARSPQADVVEQFLVSSLLDDPDYPALPDE